MSKQILLCDDEVHILRAAEFKLARAGFQVRCATDGQEAWESILRQVPDIVVTDCQMPRLDGLGLVRRMREDERFRNIPIILLTAKGLELPHDELEAQWGVSAVFSKPFSPRELLRAVEARLQPETVS